MDNSFAGWSEWLVEARLKRIKELVCDEEYGVHSKDATVSFNSVNQAYLSATGSSKTGDGMRAIGIWLWIATFCFGASFTVRAETKAGDDAKPMLMHTCLITSRFGEMVSFYERVLEVAPAIINGNYAEFATGGSVVAIFTAEAQEAYIPGSAEAGKNRSAILEFRVGNVDGEFTRLRGFLKVLVKPPTTQPWGTRSFYFRDPDGNLVDFYARVSK